MSFKSEKEIHNNIDLIRKSKCFDEEWYLETYPDVELLGMDPVEHYVKFGADMRRDPNPEFSTDFHCNTHRDVKRLGLNPLSHHILNSSTVNFGPDPERVLWAAGLESIAGHHERAIQFAEKHLRNEDAHTLNLLRANEAAYFDSLNTWLESVNSYLDFFSIARLKLRADKNGHSLFSRLTTSKLQSIKRGPVVSVLMPAWNAEKTIEYAINSILEQTWQPLELIIVDDASTDNTWEIISRLAQNDTRVIPLRNLQNVGPYISKNIAIKYATGIWITGHDADDWAHPQRIENHVKHLTSNSKTASLMGMLRMSSKGMFTRLTQVGGNTLDGACTAGFISMMCDKLFFEENIGHWDEMRFGGDSELIQRLEKSTGIDMPRYHSVGIICLDNPEGLTNHPQFGHKPGERIARERIDYKASFQKWHKTLIGSDFYLDFPQATRRFPAPQNALNPAGKAKEVLLNHVRKVPVQSMRTISTDVCIVTNLRFPGGNASSSIDEVNFLKKNGLNVKLLHCPIQDDLGKPISTRYYELGDSINTLTDFAQIRCKTLIIRHPAVATSRLLNKHLHKLQADCVYFVVNNSQKRPSGKNVYSVEKLLETARRVRAKRFEICPISPVMRRELKNTISDVHLSKRDWTPTFDLNSYKSRPRLKLRPIYRIGRHGRDGAEKWLESERCLRQAYPNDKDFKIQILGGAKNAARILGRIPENWMVHDFGSISPKEYLKKLDCFVYFPNSSLNEGFGRTIAEAMIAGVPCILPFKFEEVFSDLALYCAPADVASLVRELGRSDSERVQYLNEVQNIVEKSFSSASIIERLSEFDTAKHPPSESVLHKLSSASKVFRQKVMASSASPRTSVTDA